MLRNYLIIAWRNLWYNKIFSFINIFGLAVAMAASLLIYLYISFELSYDNFHENDKNIYRLVGTRTIEGEQKPTETYLSPFLGWFLQSQFTEIESFARIQYEEQAEFSIQSGSNDLQSYREEKVFYVDQSILDIFSFPLLAGNPKTALLEINSLVITESLAKKYFGYDHNADQYQDVLGRTILHNGKRNYKITGVVKDNPTNSHFQFDALISMESVKNWFQDYDDDESWGWNLLYLRLAPKTNPNELSAKIQKMLEQRYHESMKKWNVTFNVQLQPLDDIHLHSVAFAENTEVRGDIRMVRFMMIICIFILAIAWTNYINITTARSMNRMKEVGIKIIVGAKRRQLIEQFIMESALINLIAFIFAATLIQVSLPFFEQLIGKDLEVDILNKADVLIITGFFIMGIIVSGFYPALLLSSFKSMSLIRGNKIQRTNKSDSRKILVAMQYMITFSLVLSTFSIYMQLSHMRNRNLGFEMEQILIVRASTFGPSDLSNAKFRVFKDRLLSHRGISNVTASNNIPGGERNPPQHQAGQAGQAGPVEGSPGRRRFIDLSSHQDGDRGPN